MPECRGCGSTFNPTSKTEILCISCLAVANTYNACRNCGAYADLNAEAHCNECRYERHTKVSWCEKCLQKRVSSPVKICDDCAKKSALCPDCQEHVIKADEYICVECSMKRGNYKYMNRAKNVRSRLTF